MAVHWEKGDHETFWGLLDAGSELMLTLELNVTGTFNRAGAYEGPVTEGALTRVRSQWACPVVIPASGCTIGKGTLKWKAASPHRRGSTSGAGSQWRPGRGQPCC